MKLPLVSIVTPTYNQAEFLKETIDSILAQTYPNIEYIVINDGSSDNTTEILETYRDRSVQIIHQANIGQTASINKGWALSKGDIIFWINSDDILAPYAVEEAVGELENHPSALAVFGNCDYIDVDGKYMRAFPVRPFTVADLLLEYGHGQFSQCSTFTRRKALDLVGFLDPRIYYCMDFDFWLMVRSKGEMVYINSKPWSFHRKHPKAKGSNRVSKEKAAKDFIYVYKKFFASPNLPENIIRMKPRAFAVMHWHAARRLHRAKKRTKAIWHLVKSIFLGPSDYTANKLKLLTKWLIGLE